LVCRAQQANPVAPVRYHFGDDPDGTLGWADPKFDDSAWLVAQNGQAPQPPFRSDGFFWVRVRISVPPGLAEPLGVQSLNTLHFWGVQAILVNGVSAGQNGRFPPDDVPMQPQRMLTFPIPDGVVQPGTTALVALRGWLPPYSRIGGGPLHFAFAIDRVPVLRTAEHADFDSALLATLPPVLGDVLLILVGLGILIFFRRVASRELLFDALWLVTVPLFLIQSSFQNAGIVPAAVGVRVWFLVYCVCAVPGFLVFPEFLWTVYQLRDRFFRGLAHACWLTFVLTRVPPILAHRPASWIPPLSYIGFGGLVLFNIILFGVDLWAFFVLRRNRMLAVAFSLINIPFFTALVGLPSSLRIGPVDFSVQLIGFFIAGVAITFMLLQRALSGSREADRLRAEFDAAREVQERLVVTPPQLPGFRLESAYLPATQVGGDFYHICPDDDGGVLIVVGDVSGKGLKAAMTVSAVIGALRTMPVLPPTRILAALNRGLVGHMGGGFVTCCVARIAPNGVITLTNAGNPAPYRNGEELVVEPGLPLGMIADVSYIETTCQLAPGDRLTFVSDGVLEATSPSGELYGFERTRAISNQPANTIAEAATQFGQEDDITVLTVIRTVGLNPMLA